MLMTREEAQYRWCPFSWQQGAKQGPCSTSYCMAWRWEDGKVVSLSNGEAIMLKDDGQKRGYCGLAGKP